MKRIRVWENRKWIGVVGVLICFVLILVFARTMSSRAETTEEIGEVTFTVKDGWYLVENEQQIFALASNDIKDPDMKFKLTQDITVTTAVTKAATSSFAGTFDGQDYKITYNGINIITESDSDDRKLTTDEGILFGTVSGTIKNLFVNVNNANYQFKDIYQLNVDNKTVILTPNNGEKWLGTTGEDRNTILTEIQEPGKAYTKNGDSYVAATGNIGIDENAPNDEQVFYYKHNVTGSIEKDKIEKDKAKKEVFFGLVGAVIEKGYINNLQVEGTINATTTENRFMKEASYTTQNNQDISRYYAVSYTRRWLTKEENELQKYAFLFAYDKEKDKVDFSLPLYDNGVAKYEQYEDDNGDFWFTIPASGNTPEIICPVYDIGAQEIRKQDNIDVAKEVGPETRYAYLYGMKSDGEPNYTIPLYKDDGVTPIYRKIVDTAGNYWYEIEGTKYPAYGDVSDGIQKRDVATVSVGENAGAKITDQNLEATIASMRTGVKYVSTAPDLYAGAVAGRVTKGTISGVIQKTTVNGKFLANIGERQSEKLISYLHAGGITGHVSQEATVTDCYITKKATATTKVADVMESFKADVTGAGDNTAQASCYIIDHGSWGTTVGKGEIKTNLGFTTFVDPQDPENPIVKDDTIITITPDVFGQKNVMDSWMYFPQEVTANKNVYTLKWLVKECGYTHEITGNITKIDMTVDLEQFENSDPNYTKGTLRYRYRPDIDKGEVNTTKTLNNTKSISINNNTELGVSGYLAVELIYNTDGKYYYYKEFGDEEYIFTRMDEDDPNFITTYEDFLIREEGQDYIQVTGNMPESGSAAVFYYITTPMKYPVRENTSGHEDYLTARQAAGKFVDGKWRTNIIFDGNNVILKGFWRLDNTLYPVYLSREYTADDQMSMEAPKDFSISRYYKNDESLTPYYAPLPVDDDRKLVYAGQNIQIKDYATDSANGTKNIEYLCLFTQDKKTASDSNDFLNDGLTYTCNLTTGVSNLSIPDSYAEGDEFYLYILKTRKGIPGGLATMKFKMITVSEITTSKPSNSVLINGTGVEIDMGELTGADGLQGVRYLITSRAIQNIKTLANVEGVTSVAYQAGEKIDVAIEREENEMRKYLYVQYYGKYDAEDICGPLHVLEYAFADKTGTPSITPNTIVYTGESGTVGAFTVETNTKAELSAAQDSTIVYLESESETAQLSYSKVKEESTLAMLAEKTQDGQNSCIIMERLYVKSNEFWYLMSKGAQVYNSEEGIELSNSSQAVKYVHISAIAFEEEREQSDVIHYVYEVEPQEETAAPTAVLATSAEEPTAVALNSSLFFQSATPDAEIYYTLDGTVPDTTEGGSTKKYNTQKGIIVEGEYDGVFRVNLIAVNKDSNGELTLKPSKSVSFVYKIEEQNTVAAPTSIPATSDESPAVVTPGKKILLSSETNGADIYYTVDGTEPKVKEDGTVKKGTKYDASTGIMMPEDGSDFFTIKAIAVKEGMKHSQIVQLIFSYPNKVLPPYASPASGVVDSGTSVSLTNATEDATIYYEVAYGGSKPKTPEVTSAVYDSEQPFVITQKTTIKAMAVKDGVKSNVETFTYTTSKLSNAPTASIPSGSVVSRNTMLNITSDNGNATYYTIDGSEPTDVSNSNVVSGQSLLLDGEYGDVITVKACAKASDRAFSDVSTFTYQISKYQGGVTSDLETGAEASNGATVNLMSDITNATIYYTVDGTSPSAGSASGTAVTLSGEPGSVVTVKAMAIPEGVMVDAAGSSTAIFNYKIKDTITAPEASPGGGMLTSQISVTLTAAKGDIYYTTDGSTPSINSTQYKDPITVNKSMVIKAIAATPEGEVSPVSTFTYSTAMRAAVPTSSKADGVLAPGTVVNLSSQTSGATIYFSTDGTTPTADNLDSLLVYDGEGITINRTVSIQAVAYKDGYLLSNSATFHFEVTDIPAVIEKEKREAEEAEKGLKDTDATALKEKSGESVKGPSFSGIVLKDKDFNTMVSADLGIIPENTRLIVTDEDCADSVLESLQVILGEEYEVISLYDMSLYEESNSIQPDGELEIGIPIPKEYENAALQIVYVDQDGTVKKVDTRRYNGMAYAKTDHFSIYGLAGVKNEEQSKFAINVVYLVVGIALLIAVGGIVFFCIQLKRKKLPKRVRKNL